MTNLFITGSGIVSSHGTGVVKNWKAMLAEQSGITDFMYNDDQVDNIKDEISYLAVATEYQGEERFFDMAHAAFKETISSAKLSKKDLANTGLIFSHGTPNNVFVAAQAKKVEAKGRSRPDAVLRSMNSYVASRLAEAHEINQIVVSNAAACCGTAQAIHLAVSLIKSGAIDRVIVGGGEVIDYFTYRAFKSMRVILSSTKTAADSVQPFGENRNGIRLGEGAGFIVIENDTSLTQRQAVPKAKLLNSSYMNVPKALLGNIPNSSYWEGVIKNLIEPNTIDYLISHATSTIKGDQVEAEAIVNLMPDCPVTSLKYLFGHSLSASCILDIVMLIECIKNQTAIGTGNHYMIDSELKALNLLHAHRTQKINTAVKLSAGFGGGISAISLSKI